MNPYTFQLNTGARKSIAYYLKSLTVEQANFIPDNFRNNVAWHFAHVLAVHQSLTYLGSGVEPTLPKDFITEFQRGTRPHRAYTQADFNLWVDYSKSSSKQLIADLSTGIFKTYKPLDIELGVRISNIEEAVMFNAVHESIHLGYVMAMRNNVISAE